MKNARGVALRALVAMARGQDERLRAVLKTDGLAPRDQAFAFELAHGVLRRERLLDHVLSGLAHRGLPDDPWLVAALRLGAYQLLLVPGMPTHAAVHETVELVRGNRGFANAILRALVKAIVDRPAASPEHELALGPTRALVLPKPLPVEEERRLAVVHSLPDFLLARWQAQLGGDAMRQVAVAASATPRVWLRIRRGVDAAQLCSELAAEEVVVAIGDEPSLLQWTGGRAPFATASFRAGKFVVQDPTAVAAAAAVPCGPGDTVVDLCAAPGTKATALAERVQPGGRVFAYDVDSQRRERIAENVARLRLESSVTIVGDAKSLPVADAVLADVPCSNTGVLARRVEVRRRLQPTTFAELAALQRRLLRQAFALCRPGGAVVYSTCSIDRDENEDVVDAVLAETGPTFTRGAQRLTLPQAEVCDGGYFAVLWHRPG